MENNLQEFVKFQQHSGQFSEKESTLEEENFCIYHVGKSCIEFLLLF